MPFEFKPDKNSKHATLAVGLTTLTLFLLISTINGLSAAPGQLYFRISQNPFVSRTDINNDNYWQETVLFPMAAFYLHLNEPAMFNAFCFFVIMTAFLIFAVMSYHRFGLASGSIFSTILITNPVTTVLLSWLGMPDGLTFLLIIPLLFTTSAAAILILTILGAANHMVFIIAALEISVLRWLAKDGIRFSHVCVNVLGCGIGYSLVQLYLTANHIQVSSRLDFIISKSLDFWIGMNAGNFAATFFSFFNVQWFILLISLLACFKEDRKVGYCILAFLLFNFGITFFTLDQTRIFSLLSWGVLMISVFRSHIFDAASDQNKDLRNAAFRKRIALLILLLLFIAPRYYSWGGYIVATPFWTYIYQFLQ